MQENDGKRKQKIENALIKKALGYQTEEVVEEYVESEGEIKLNKKKVTKKSVPPDITALKILIESEKQIREMTDEELQTEKERLLKILSAEQKK